MYFIKSGRVLLKASNGAIFRAYPLGSYFGEIELLENSNRSSIAQVSTKPAELLTLSKKCLELMFKEFPEIMEELTRVAKIRKKLNNDAMDHVLKLKVDDSSSEEDSSSESQNLEEEPLKPPDWLIRRDTGIFVSHMTISPNKVKNISKWSKAVKDSKRARSVFNNQSTETLIARQRSMKKLASFKYLKSKKDKLLRIRKAMKVEEDQKRKIEILDDLTLFEDSEQESKVLDFPVQGLFGDLMEIDGILNDHADDSAYLMKQIEVVDLKIIEDCKRLQEYCRSKGLVESTYEM